MIPVKTIYRKTRRLGSSIPVRPSETHPVRIRNIPTPPIHLGTNPISLGRINRRCSLV